MAVLKTYLNWAHAKGIMQHAPHRLIKPLKDTRTIPVNRRLAEILRHHRQPTGYLLTPEPIANRTRPQRARKEQGKRTYRYDPKKVWNRIISRVIKAGGKRITPHGMRHSFASAHLICNVPEMKVARWLGHADTTMIHERYGHLLAYDRGIYAVCYPSGERCSGDDEQ